MGNLSEHFSRWEFRCGGKNSQRCPDQCGYDTVDVELLKVLEDLHEYYGHRAITVNCGCRCLSKNRSTPGASKRSQHLYGKAADIVIDGVDPEQVYAYLTIKYPDNYGIGKYNTFIHIDTRSGRGRWNG